MDTYYFKVVVISTTDSSVVWESDVFEDPGWDVAYSPDGSLIIVSTGSNSVIALDAGNGDVVWSTELPVQGTYGVAVTQDTVYVGAFIKEPYSGSVIALRIGSGEILWNTGGFDDAVLTLSLNNDGSKLLGGIGIDYGNERYGGKVIALNPLTGEKLWETEEFDDYVWGVAEVPGMGMISAGVESGKISFISVDTGEVVKTITIDENRILDSLTVLPDQPMILVSLEDESYNGIISAYLVSSGAVTQATSLPAGEWSSPSTEAQEWTSPATAMETHETSAYPITTPQGTEGNPLGMILIFIGGGAIIAVIVIVLKFFILRPKPYAPAPPPPPPP